MSGGGDSGAATGTLSLVVRRTIQAPPEQLFAAWTQPEQLQRWWGPAGVVCAGAEIDLRVGGRYRIANRLADGRIVWIAGAFERIEAPRILVFTWGLEPTSGPAQPERVTVRFEPRGGSVTQVVVLHERIADEAARRSHEQGWQGCLDGLTAHLQP